MMLAAYSLLSLVLLALALLAVPMSVTMFDAPGSNTSLLTWALALGVLVAPLILVGGPVVGWAAFAAKGYRASRWAMAVLPLWLAYTAVVVLLLSTFCDGRFAC